MKTAGFFTLGCKVNQYDTQSIRESFLKNGFLEAPEGRKADFCVINTCTVTKDADQKSRNTIRRCIKKNPAARIIVTGCLTQDESSLRNIKGISYIIGKRFFREGVSGFSGHTRAFLKIQDGCDNFCSYCKVPLARGRSRSRQLNAIISEAEELVRKGFREIVLTGICLGAFGRDLKPKADIVDIIEELENINGLLRIRLSSIEAGDVSNRLIAKMARSKKLCRHLHIPMQSGDDSILKAMRRKYTKRIYLDLVKRIKKAIPEVAITTDVLVGFPGESEENFQNSVDLIKRILLLKAHIFPFSARCGTQAASVSNRVSTETIKRRIVCLRRVSDECSLRYRSSFLGKTATALIEAQAKFNPGYWQGYTDNYLKVLVKSKANLKGRFIKVNLNKISGENFLAAPERQSCGKEHLCAMS